MDISTISPFMNLSKSELQKFQKFVSERMFLKGELITLTGEPCEAAYFVLDGVVAVYRLSLDGKKQILHHIRPGESFNKVPLFLPDAVNLSSSEAVTDCKLVILKRKDVERILMEFPRLAGEFIRDFANKLKHMTDLVEDLSLNPVQKRLARFLIRQADDPIPDKRFTYDDIAARIGTVRDVVGRCMRTWEEQGMIKRENGKILIQNRDAIFAIAEEN